MRQSQAQNTIELTPGQVLTMTVDSLIKHFNLVAGGYKFCTEDILSHFHQTVLRTAIEPEALVSEDG